MTSRLVLAALVTGIGLAGCTANGGASAAPGFAGAMPDSSSNRTSREAYLLGKVAAQELLTNHPLYRDDAATRYLNELGQSLAMLSAAEIEPYRGYRFAIVDDPEPNAYAVPGAFIFVTRGLLRTCQSEEELAAVLAHEIAHVSERHAINAEERGRAARPAASVGAQALLQTTDAKAAPAVAPAAELATATTAAIVNRAYARDDELKADQAALVLLQRAGYPPAALRALLDRLSTADSSADPDMLRGHPALDTRRAALPNDPRLRASAPRQRRFEAALGSARR